MLPEAACLFARLRTRVAADGRSRRVRSPGVDRRVGGAAHQDHVVLRRDHFEAVVLQRGAVGSRLVEAVDLGNRGRRCLLL